MAPLEALNENIRIITVELVLVFFQHQSNANANNNELYANKDSHPGHPRKKESPNKIQTQEEFAYLPVT